MGRQTVVQDGNTIRFGSAMVEVGADVASLNDVGAARNVVFQETWEKVRVPSDNAGDVHVGIRNHRAGIRCNMMEIDLANLATIRGGLDDYSTAAATPVQVDDEAVVLPEGILVRLANKNADNSEVASIVVAATEGGVGLTLDTDYAVAVDGAGYTGIVMLSGGAISDGQTVFVSYEYTPAASRTLTSGGNVVLADRVIRLTNTNEAGDIFRITIYKASAEEGINLELQADEATDPAMVAVNLIGVVDRTRTKGDQLFEIYDEQS